jgi:hypothetical protein
MTNPICTDIVCDTTVPTPTPPIQPVPTPTCGLPTNQVFTHATIHTNASGCISHIESGEPFVYTPDPCCPDSGTGTGGGGTGLDGPKGDTGAAATVTVGSVTTGAPGSAVSVVNVGTANAAILNITIPAGQPGLDGALPSGLTYSQNGMEIDGGLVQNMPSWWPPVVNFVPTSASGDGITLVFTKDVNGNVATTVSAGTLLASWAAAQAIQDSNINALTSTVATLQLAHDSLQNQHTILRTEHDTLKARVDAAGIP